VTGGMSLVVGALKPAAAAEAWVCGSNPVRTMGGCSKVEMALWPASRTELPRRDLVSRAPPIEPMDAMLAVLPLLGWYLLFDDGRLADSWLGKGKAETDRGEDGELLSMDMRGEGADMAGGEERKGV
jgi:hypothetical protein